MIAKPDNTIIQVLHDERWVDYNSYRCISRKSAIQKLAALSKLNDGVIFRLKFEDWETGRSEVL